MMKIDASSLSPSGTGMIQVGILKIKILENHLENRWIKG
jgi:hypothetical protein